MIRQAFFSVFGQSVTVDGQETQIFEYPGLADAASEATTVAPDGNTIGANSVYWPASNHFFRSAI